MVKTKVCGTKEGVALLEKTAAAIKGSISGVDGEEMKEIVRSHYRTMRLMDDQSNWTLDRLSNLDEALIPGDLSPQWVGRFVDDMADLCLKNEYLMHFFSSEADGSFPVLEQKFKTQGEEVLPDVVGYAIALQSLCSVLSDDWQVLEEVFHHFIKVRKESGSGKELPLFHKIKLFSVEKPFKNYLEAHHSREIKPKSGRTGVSINILEATWTDFKSGIRGNAAAGKVLADHKCGSLKVNPATGEGPSGWSENGKLIQRSYPIPLKWADLYQAWNMCFVTRFRDFPYVIPKLFIPLVASYQDEPQSYIYNRAIALYVYLNFSSFDYLDKKRSGEAVIDWYDREFSLAFGKANARMAKEYKAEVRRLRKKA